MKDKIKRSLKVCEDCDQFYFRQLIHGGKIIDSEYKCNHDVYTGSHEAEYGSVGWQEEYLKAEHYRLFRISDKCPYKLEHAVLGQKIIRNEEVCKACKDYSGWSLFGERKCLWSPYDANRAHEFLKMDRTHNLSELMDMVNSFKCKRHLNKDAYENEVPKECPLMLEQMVMEDEKTIKID